MHPFLHQIYIITVGELFSASFPSVIITLYGIKINTQKIQVQHSKLKSSSVSFCGLCVLYVYAHIVAMATNFRLLIQ